MIFMSLLDTICSQLHKSMWVTFINSNKLASPPLKFFSFFSLNTIHKANRNMIKPWPQSPNMTAKRNGNVMMVNRAVCRKKVKKTKQKNIKFIWTIEWKATYIDILKVLYIFPGWLCYFKGLFIPVWCEIHQLKFYMWHRDNWSIAQWLINLSCRSRHSICQSFFSPRAFIIWIKSIQVKQADLETWSLAPTRQDHVHWSLLHSLLTTYERSTCSKSTTYSVN